MKTSPIRSVRHTLVSRGLKATIVAVLRLFYASLERVVFRRLYIKRRIYNFALYLDPLDKGISRTLILFGQRELDHKWIMEQCLEEGDSILDIGANIGYYVAMEAKLVGSAGKIYAFEPSQKNFNLLMKNLELNSISDQVSCTLGAISNISGTEEFFISDMSNLNTFHKSPNRQYKSVEVPTYSVNKVLIQHTDIKYIRMDVEGHEVEILRAAIPTLSEPSSDIRIIFEFHISRYESTDFLITLGRLWDAGYRCRYLSSSNARGSLYFSELGYRPLLTVDSDEHARSIFEHVALEDLTPVISGLGGARTALLQKAQF